MKSRLDHLVDEAIGVIRRMEKVALRYSDTGYHVAFSGGKDSQVIYELSKMAGVKFQAFFYKTSVDAPELLKFIRDHYSDVIWLKPERTMFQLILDKKMLPLRNARFCCEVIKERRGLNEVVIIGIRREESTRRAKREVFTNDCRFGCDKPLLAPILDWTRRDVFEFLGERGVEVCSLYEKFSRIGCIGCPMSGRSQREEFRMFPQFRKAYVNTVERLRTEQGRYLEFESADDAVDWWCSGKNRKTYLADKEQLRLPLFDDELRLAS